MPFKIATWNLCLSILNKKDLILEELTNSDIDVCCMQETEIDCNVPLDALGSVNYDFIAEKNSDKIRVGLYINKRVSYVRRSDLEEENCHLIIIDLNLDYKYRIITLYRSFRPPDGLSQLEFFRKQIGIVEKSITIRTIVLGDFNLDVNKQFMQNYANYSIYNRTPYQKDNVSNG